MMSLSNSTMPPRREQHPLFNTIVQERIFGFLTLQNLKNVRLVCKSWSKISSPLLQSVSQVTLVRGRGEEIEKRKSSFKKFIAYIETLPEDQVFFRNYHVEHWILNEKREKNLHVFWLKCGPTMKSLHLDNIIFYEVATLRNVLYHWAPSLESLRIEDCLFYTITQENIPPKCEEYLSKEDFDEEYIFFDYYDHITVEQLKNVEADLSIKPNLGLRSLHYEQWEEEVMPLAWEEVFAAFPNLKTLKLSPSLSEGVISEILNNVGILQLESLSFSKSRQGESQLTDSHLVQICDLKPSLTQLELYFGETVSIDALEITVKEHHRTLKTLQLHFPNNSSAVNESGIFVQFPLQKWSFPNLATLSVSQELLRGQTFPQCFLKMGSLSNLQLWDGSNEFNWEELMDNIFVSCANKDVDKTPPLLLNSLQTFYCGYVVKSCPFYELIFSACPNLKVLKCPLNNEQMRIVYKYLDLIEEITVYDRYLSDEGITGNPIILTEHTEWSGESQREFRYIGDLKRLRKFTLQYWKYDGITDASVYHGFADVHNLCHLRITKTQISYNALQNLATKSNLITLISPKVSKGDVL